MLRSASSGPSSVVAYMSLPAIRRRGATGIRSCVPSSPVLAHLAVRPERAGQRRAEHPVPRVLPDGLWRTRISQLSECLSSEWGEEHENLVPGVVGSQTELAWPSSRLSPAEPGVEVFEPNSAADSEMELFEAHLLACDPAQLVHQ